MVPIVQEAGWAPGPVWTGAENLAPPPGFDHRTVQPVASRYTDYATRSTHLKVLSRNSPELSENKTGNVIQRNSDKRSRTHCLHGTAISIKYYERVSAFLPQSIGHAMRMRRIILSSL